MPRPRHPIREHFHEIPDSSRKNGAISCNYCGKEQSAGNPKRCQKHLDECPQYAALLAVVDAGGDASFPPNPYDSPSHASPGPTHSQAYPGTGAGQDALQQNNFAAAGTPGGGMQPQMPVASPERAMSEENIMRVLHINDATYLAIERELDSQLQHLNISGAGLHTNTGRTLLKQAFYQVHQRWPDVFNDIHEQDKTQALTAMANICNRKRRNGAPPSAGPLTPSSMARGKGGRSSMSSPLTAAGAMQHMQQGSPALQTSTFGTMTIIAERADSTGGFVVCRPADLLDHAKPAEEITVNDVRFGPFVGLLQSDDDVMFNLAEDKIMFTFTGGRTKSVANEVVWRVALEEMHKKGMDPFVFRIYKRTAV